MNLDQHWNIIARLLKNDATKDDLNKLDIWLNNVNNAKFFNDVFFAYRATGTFPKFFNPDKTRAWEKIENEIISNKNKTRQKQIIFSTAVICSVFILGFTFLFKTNIDKLKQLSNQQTQIISPLGQKTKIILPDNSSVWLNSGSTLKYQADFNSKNREVILEGEAFFEIQKDISKRFRVRTGILNVDVYGTEFNIKNYSDDDFQEITVIKGKVGISDKSREIKQLTKGEQALFDKKTNKILFTHDVPQIISAWKNNELIFDNTPLEEVVKYLERWYGVNIAIEEAMNGKHNYTFKVKTESFREILEMMKEITPLKYEIEGKDIKLIYSN